MRFIDLGEVSALRSQAAYHAVSSVVSRDQDDTVLLMVPSESYVSVGLYQEVGRNIDADYCAANGLPVFRRQLGGRSLLIEAGHHLFQAVLNRRRAARSVTRIYHDTLRVALEVYRKLGVDVHYMPVSDVYVRKSRLGGSAVGRLDEAMVLASELVYDYDIERAQNVFLSTEDEYTSVARETKRSVDLPKAREYFIAAYEELMEASFEPGELTDGELAEMARFEELLPSADWVWEVDNRVTQLRADAVDGASVGEGMNVVEGGFIRAIARVVDGVIDDLVLSGDFFFYEDYRHALEQALIGCDHEWENLMTSVENYYLLQEVDSPGASPSDWVTAVSRAFQDAAS